MQPMPSALLDNCIESNGVFSFGYIIYHVRLFKYELAYLQEYVLPTQAVYFHM